MRSILETVRHKAVALWEAEDILNEDISVKAAPLTVEQAIGKPEGLDFPIQKGKEKLMEATFHGRKGQSFTDQFGNYAGTLADVAALPLESNFDRAVFVATLNAVSRYLGQADHTIHCRDEGPKQCATKVAAHIRERFGNCRVTIIGFQPTLAEAMNQDAEVRLVDLDPDNIGKVKRGVLVEGEEATQSAIEWCDVLLVTGTTLANDSIHLFVDQKPVVFYGTTISGAAALMGWDRFCPASS